MTRANRNDVPKGVENAFSKMRMTMQRNDNDNCLEDKCAGSADRWKPSHCELTYRFHDLNVTHRYIRGLGDVCNIPLISVLHVGVVKVQYIRFCIGLDDDGDVVEVCNIGKGMEKELGALIRGQT